MNPVVLGTVMRPHGLRGEVSVQVFNPDSELLAKGRRVWVEGQGWKRILASAGTRLRFEGVDSREAADALRGATLTVDRAELPAPDDDEYYLHDLIGFSVHDPAGNVVGTLRGLQTSGAREYLVVAGARELLLPAEAPAIARVELPERRIWLAVDLEGDAEEGT